MAVVVTNNIANRSAWSIGSPIRMLLFRQINRLVLHFQVESRHLIFTSVASVGCLGSSCGCSGLKRLPIGDPEVILVARGLAVLVSGPDSGYWNSKRKISSFQGKKAKRNVPEIATQITPLTMFDSLWIPGPRETIGVTKLRQVSN